MWGKILTRIFAMFGLTLTCVACYGSPWTEYNDTFSARGIVQDSDGNPIEGIRVSMAGDENYTNSNGRFYVQDITRNVTFEDVDGEAGGGEFITTTRLLNGPEDDLGIVTLYREGEERDNE